MDSASSWSPLKKILPYFLDYVIPSYSSSRPFVFFSHTGPISYVWLTTSLFWHILFSLYTANNFNFLTPLNLFQVGTFLVLLFFLILHCSSYLLNILVYSSSCCHNLHCFRLFYELRVPLPIQSPAYICFNFLVQSHLSERVHILILVVVPRCGSVRIASILPTWDLPFPITFAVCVSHVISPPKRVSSCVKALTPKSSEVFLFFLSWKYCFRPINAIERYRPLFHYYYTTPRVWATRTIDSHREVPLRQTYIIKYENTLQLWDRRFRRNSSLQAVYMLMRRFSCQFSVWQLLLTIPWPGFISRSCYKRRTVLKLKTVKEKGGRGEGGGGSKSHEQPRVITKKINKQPPPHRLFFLFFFQLFLQGQAVVTGTCRPFSPLRLFLPSIFIAHRSRFTVAPPSFSMALYNRRFW